MAVHQMEGHYSVYDTIWCLESTDNRKQNYAAWNWKMLIFEGVNGTCCVGCCQSGNWTAQTQMLGGVLQNSCCNIQLEGGTKVRPCVHLKPLVTRERHLSPEWRRYSTVDNSAVKRPLAGSFLIDLIDHLMPQLRHQCRLWICPGSVV